MVWGAQAIDNIEMVLLWLFDQTDPGAKPRPDIGEQLRLAGVGGHQRPPGRPKGAGAPSGGSERSELGGSMTAG